MLTKDQLLERKKGIGGSDAAAIFGFSKYKTPLQLYFDKIEDDVPEQQTSEEADWGNEMEPVLLNAYQKKHPLVVVETYKNLFYSEKYPWMIGNIDGLGVVNDPLIAGPYKIVVECKSSRRYGQWGQPGTNEIPDDYLIQGAHYAIVLDADRVDFAVSICGSPLRVYHYHRDEKIEKTIIDAERYFWEEHVLKRIPPDPSTTEEAAKVWREATGEIKTAPLELTQKYKELSDIKKQIKELQIKEENLKLEFQLFMKDASLLQDEAGNKLFSWNNINRNILDTKKLREKYPTIYEEFSKATTTRMFLMKQLKMRD